MNIALRRPLTVPEFVAWADSQGEQQRAELINGQIFSMSPERVEHIELKFQIALALTRGIAEAGAPCHALADGATVAIDAHTAYQPDALVYCGERMARGAIVVPSPIVIVEVLSPSTAHTDTSAKLIGYFKLPSVQHYLIIDPETMTLTHHVRDPGGSTSSTPHASGRLRLDPPGLTLDLDPIFGAQ